MQKKVTAVLLGAGGRGNVYSRYAKVCPEKFSVVAVAEPDEKRRNKFCKEYAIARENAYASWEELLSKPRLADAALICTMDDMHTAPSIMAMEKGYHVLLEKPMANREDECNQIGEAAEKSGLVLSVCHVLRYSPFYSTLKRLIDSKVIGEPMVFQQIENVGYWHQAHSFVRGNWANSKETSSMILQKCCHDMDIISWILGGKCTKVSSFGSLTHFKAENAPQGAPKRCTDGCPHEENCPYYAPRFYLEHPRAVADGFVDVLTTDPSREGILQALREGPYGRCVYHCGNDVVDHQVVNMEFDSSALGSLVMTAFTNDCHRSLHIMGTKGEIIGDMEKGELFYQIFGAPTPLKADILEPPFHEGFHHSGGDFCLIRDFVEAVQNNNSALNRSTARQSLQSHRMCFAAEESRLLGKTVML